MATKLPRQDVRFADTRGAGGVSVRGFELDTDEDGCIEGPSNLAAELAPHGFVPEGSPEFAAFMEQRKQAQKAAAVTGKR